MGATAVPNPTDAAMVGSPFVRLAPLAWALLAASVAFTRPCGAQAAEPASTDGPPLPAREPPKEEGASEHVQLRYMLQGIEVRGNTRTRARVVLRYVPFRAGDLLDVNDPEVELTRYRLLGTGFFSSV